MTRGHAMPGRAPDAPLAWIATAPAKVILIGEHAVNRGAAAVAVSVGLHARCRVVPGGAAQYRFTGGGHVQQTSRAAIVALAQAIDRARDAHAYAAIEELAAHDFFAPAKYALAGLDDALPDALDVQFTSEIPQAAGLGSGGAAVVALMAAVTHALRVERAARQLALLALRGDIVAHGGVASGLDSQTSLYGRALRYTTACEGEPIAMADGLTLVIGHCGVTAATSAVNARVRAWLAEQPERIRVFHEIGALAHAAEAALRDGDWPELGRLMNRNQRILRQIGVSCPELDTLTVAAIDAGAYGAKLSGSGGGGIMVALTAPGNVAPVAAAIARAGGRPIIAPVGVPGVSIRIDDDPVSSSVTKEHQQ